MIIDHSAREQALNPTQSLIVRAPAGSGKTSLLIQRFLNLLNGHVEHPNEIYALTFTLKACEEMKERIHQALNTPSELSNSILKLDEKFQWGLKNNLEQLNIMTLDALSNQIHQHSDHPLSSLDPSLYPNLIYQEACEELILNTRSQDAIETLIQPLGYDAGRLNQLLCYLLGKRDQWMPYLASQEKLIDVLSNHINLIREHLTTQCQLTIPKNIQPQWLELLTSFINHESMPDITPSLLFNSSNSDEWSKLGHWLLTAKGEFKKRLTKNEGFLPQNKELKESALSWIEMSKGYFLDKKLSQLIHAPNLEELQECKNFYQALTSILPELCAYLFMSMKKNQAIDFIEINSSSMQQLQENPDIQIMLNSKVRHLLIDEFQDTSQTHYQLIEQLTNHFEPHKTVFIVGDPMQSIYRFRQADVGLYLKTFEKGLTQKDLKPVTLQCNFRSSPNIVEFNNHVFKNLFPSSTHINTAAVSFSKAVPENTSPGTVNIHRTPKDFQAQLVSKILKSSDIKGDIAILAKTRKHLNEIALELEKENISYQGVELSPLTSQPLIQDLLSLNQSLTDHGNKLSWLSVLRSPFVGLSINDIHTISQCDITHYPSQLPNILGLSNDAKHRLEYLLEKLNQVLKTPLLFTRVERLKEAMIQLEIEHYYDETQQQHLPSFFETIHTVEMEGQWHQIEKYLESSWANYTNDSNIHLMTIHKSKGLEFDHVILTHLDRKNMQDKAPLIYWDDYHNDQQNLPLLFPGHVGNTNAQFMKKLNKDKDIEESKRLFYVALTRCKYHLHVLQPYQNDVPKGTWSEWLEDSIQSLPEHSIIEHTHTFTQNTITPVDEECLITLQPELKINHHTLENHSSTSLKWEEQGASLGTLIHEAFHECQSKHILYQEFITYIENKLLWQTLSSFEVIKWNKMKKSLPFDPYLQWILNPFHSKTETQFSYLDQKRVRSIRLDKLMIHNNHAWIIDIKTEDVSSIMDICTETVQKHDEQLSLYAHIIKQAYPFITTVQLVIYYPVNGQCLHWDSSLKKPSHLSLEALDFSSNQELA